MNLTIPILLFIMNKQATIAEKVPEITYVNSSWSEYDCILTRSLKVTCF